MCVAIAYFHKQFLEAMIEQLEQVISSSFFLCCDRRHNSIFLSIDPGLFE